MKTRDCNHAIIQGRLSRAQQFYDLAEAARDDTNLGDAFVTNCVLAGIAAADVLCCLSLGIHAQEARSSSGGEAARRCTRPCCAMSYFLPTPSSGTRPRTTSVSLTVPRGALARSRAAVGRKFSERPSGGPPQTPRRGVSQVIFLDQ